MGIRLMGMVVLALLLFAAGLFADTIPGGDVSGNWYQSHSPYYVTGNITVPMNDTLAIEPGVDVIFLGYYQFYIGDGACLEAIGTPTDSIRFFPQDTITGWQGLHFFTQNMSRLTYCVVRYAFNSGIRIRASQNVYTSHSTIAHCRAALGGGIFVDLTASLRLFHSTIAHNKAVQASGGKGGGICVWNGETVLIDSCTIDDNHALATAWDTLMPEGGGIYTFPGDERVSITNCAITNNSVGHRDSVRALWARGAGMYIGSDSVYIAGCIIRNNILKSRDYGPYIFFVGGAGIYLDFGSTGNRVDISHCDISHNQATYGGAVHVRRWDTTTIANCTFYGHEQIGPESHTTWADQYSTPSVVDIINCVVAYNVRGIRGCNECRHSNIYANSCSRMPPGFGVLDRANRNRDSCDRYYNIFLDPMFVDTANGNLHLQASSPCIDAGDSTSPMDPDSTIADMGCYYYDQSSGVEVLPGVASRAGMYGVAPNPFTSFARVPGHEAERFLLYDISGRKVGVYKGDRIAWDVPPGIYFLRTNTLLPAPYTRVLRVVKLR